MANVRKIVTAPRRDGSTKVSWRATWSSPDGKRQSKNFTRKGEADAWLREIAAGRQGGSATMTVAALGAKHHAWFDGLVKAGIREPGTLDGYATALDLHVASDVAFAKTRLADLTSPKVQRFLDDLFLRAGSAEVAKRTRKALVVWCGFGQRSGWLISNPAEPCKVMTTDRPEEGDERCTLPPKAQLGALLAAAEAGPFPIRDTAVVRLLMFGGLRISELLGLANDAVKPGANGGVVVGVRERLERRHVVLGRVKSKKASRDVPMGELAGRAVKAWRLSRGPVKGFEHVALNGTRTRVTGRLFPNPSGGDLWKYDDFVRDCWLPMMARAGLVESIADSKGKNRPTQAFGPHAMRHVAASLWIEQGLAPKKVQELLGHSTLQLTMDLYGHLWRDDEQDYALAQASEALIAVAKTTA